MTASEVFESVTGSGSNDFALLVSVLNERGPWCLIGGLAVNCYVVPEYTLDADIVITTLEADSIKQDLANAGFSVEEFPHSISAKMKSSDFEFQLTTDTRHQKFLIDTKLMEVLGQRVPVASLVNIARAKIWAWSDETRRPAKRKKDELDLLRLLDGYPELRSLMPEEIGKQIPD